MWNACCKVNLYDSVSKDRLQPARRFTSSALQQSCLHRWLKKKKKKRKERKKLGHEFAARSVFESPRFCIRFGTRVSALSRNSLVLSESHLKGVFACR